MRTKMNLSVVEQPVVCNDLIDLYEVRQRAMTDHVISIVNDHANICAYEKRKALAAKKLQRDITILISEVTALLFLASYGAYSLLVAIF